MVNGSTVIFDRWVALLLDDTTLIVTGLMGVALSFLLTDLRTGGLRRLRLTGIFSSYLGALGLPVGLAIIFFPWTSQFTKISGPFSSIKLLLPLLGLLFIILSTITMMRVSEPRSSDRDRDTAAEQRQDLDSRKPLSPTGESTLKERKADSESSAAFSDARHHDG